MATQRLIALTAGEGDFEAVRDDLRFCLRRLEVVQHVARVLDIRVIDNDVFARSTVRLEPSRAAPNQEVVSTS
jgi:hypothetical protein